MARASLVFFVLLLGLLSSSWARHHVDDPPRGSRREREMERHEQEERTRRDPGSRGRGRHGEDEPGQLQIELGEAREVLQSDGGRLRVWSEEIDAIRNTYVGIAELELEQDGLLVPQYADSDKIGYVLQGHGQMGAVVPGAQSKFRRTFVRRVEKGDVIALPKGTVYWWYNDGNERHRVLCAGDTTFGANPGRFHQFGLAGSQQARFGSVLHGFSQETLATAWGVDQQTIESLLSRQNAAGIVKAKQKIRFPEMPDERRRRGEEEENTLTDYISAHSSYFEELKYSIRSERPDFFVENGGWLSIVNFHKLPALHQVGFSAVKVSLEKNVMAAPSFVRNAHQLIYITRGNGRVQVASGDGQKVFDEDVREGTVLAIPQFFPSLKIAGDQGMEWINLLTSDRPSTTFLAGRNSVYKGIPKQVIAAAFNVDEDTLRELGRDEEVIFPARRGGRGERDDLVTKKKETEEQQQGGGEQQKRREQEEQRRREEEEQRRRREEEKRRREEEEQRKREEEERRRRHEDEQRRRREREEEGEEEEQRRRREEEKRRREEEEQRKREEEERRRRHEDEQRRRREREEEEERRRREHEGGERRKHDEELPAWALASLQLL